MGNTSSEVTNNLKAQADSAHGPEVYKLTSVAGGGLLVDMMKKCMANKNYTEIDDYIKNNLGKFMYNDGKGENISMEKLIQYRTGGSTKAKEKESKDGHDKDDTKAADPDGKKESKHNQVTKFLGCDIEQRGAVGETFIHLCMLNGTDVHNELAKRLVTHFPAMVNDIYLGDEYYGENALHIAIVNENPNMVKFLLMHGADVHQRCCGKFFCPDDQKNGRTESGLNECPTLPVDTNYMGYSYFGEYALSFAAILNQEECVRLLIAKNADPNKQDSNGNTVLHMLVINDNLKMFKMMLEFGALLTIKNRQGLTPLTLAAKLARKDMFHFIIQITREIYFIYGNVACAAYKLTNLDTIADDGSVDINSALHLIAYSESEEHLELYDELILDLLNQKWNTFIKYTFFWDFTLYIIYLVLNGATYIMKTIYFENLNSVGCLEYEEHGTALHKHCKCVYLYPADDNRYVRTSFEIVVQLYTIAFLINTGYELFTQGFRLYMQTLLFNPTKILFLLSLVCTVLILPMRFACNVAGEDVLGVMAMILMATYMLYLGRGFRVITTFVYIVHKVLKKDVLKIAMIITIFFFGFSQAFYIVYGYGKPPVKEIFTNPLQSLVDVLVMSQHDLLIVYYYLVQTQYSVVGRILFIIFVVLITVMLMDMLIGTMARTIDHQSEFKKEWIRQWGRQVLSIEHNITAKYKLQQQKKYTNISSNGEKALLVRWNLTPDERKNMLGNIEEIREKIKKSEGEGIDLGEETLAV